MFSVLILGEPAPQGSKRHVGGGILVDSCKRLPEWRSDVRNGCLDEHGQPKARIEGPVYLSLEFALRRPKSLPKTKKVHHTKRPDMSKLVRAVEDAITSAGIWIDDSYVCASNVTKRYAEPGEQTGCHIKVMPITDHRSDNDGTIH
jgi:crossover junction endodeoxyribonuclease RusA